MQSDERPHTYSDLFGLRAALYVRMSTDLQKYSTQNQADVIREYATCRGLNIVREYADEGRSGLRMGGREALQALISDVQGGRADFKHILVYDVSRWGRFQDADESAYYEFICKEAGVQVLYCAEQFENDGSVSSTILKSIKRAMAGEYPIISAQRFDAVPVLADVPILQRDMVRARRLPSLVASTSRIEAGFWLHELRNPGYRQCDAPGFV